MITIQCDDCEKTFEVDSAEAGGKVPCPFCGDVNRVPQPQQPAAAGPASAPSGSADREHEKQIIVIRPAMFRAHPFRFSVIVLMFLGGAALCIWSLASAAIGIWLAFVGLVPLLAGLIWWVAWWAQTTFWIKCIITNRRTIRHEGVVRRHITEVLHDHVRSVDINQTFLQRIFNVGYIGVDSAGQDGVEIEIRDIPGPHRVKEVIDRYRKM